MALVLAQRQDKSKKAVDECAHEILPKVWLGTCEARALRCSTSGGQQTLLFPNVVEIVSDETEARLYREQAGVSTSDDVMNVTSITLVDDRKSLLFDAAQCLTQLLNTKKKCDEKSSTEALLLHCRMGTSRSVALLLWYLVETEKWTLKKAFEHICACRGSKNASLQTRPNVGFAQQLLRLEREVHKSEQNSISLSALLTEGLCSNNNKL